MVTARGATRAAVRAATLAGALCAACGVVADLGSYTVSDGAGAGADAGRGHDGGGRDAPAGDSPVACADQVCASPAPAGWSGPAALARGAAPTSPAPCAGAYPDQALVAHAGLVPAPASCTCTCSASSGQACGPVGVSLFQDSACATPCASNPIALGAACTPVPGSCRYYEAPAAAPTGGSCTPTATKAVPPPSWSESARLCLPRTPPASGPCCEGGELTLRRPEAAFGAALCIYSDGDVPCPAGPYGSRTVFYRSLLDDRACSGCACSLSGGSCDGQFTPFKDSACMFASTPYPQTAACTPLSVSDPPAAFEAATPPLVPGTCSPSGGVPVGGETASEPVTVCCDG